MNKYQLKERIRAVKKSTWIYLSVMTLIVALGIGLGIMGMYMSGFTFASWMAEYYPFVIVGIAFAIIVGCSVGLTIYKKRK